MLIHYYDSYLLSYALWIKLYFYLIWNHYHGYFQSTLNSRALCGCGWFLFIYLSLFWGLPWRRSSERLQLQQLDHLFSLSGIAFNYRLSHVSWPLTRKISKINSWWTLWEWCRINSKQWVRLYITELTLDQLDQLVKSKTLTQQLTVLTKDGHGSASVVHFVGQMHGDVSLSLYI